MRPAAFLALCLGLSCAGALGCKRVSEGARQHFANQFFCPEANIDVWERPDFDPLQAVAPVEPRAETPEEVKNSPALLEKWKADLDIHREEVREEYSDYEVFQLTGCDHTELLGCERSPERWRSIKCLPARNYREHPP
jgi:hypothetical protein